jgi:cyclopropane-fatty-acyl-phospholipid synthase
VVAGRRRPRPPAPRGGGAGRGEHSTDRDGAAISYHHDQSNDLYATLLDEHMAYSCAYFREDPATDAGAADGSYGITEAQRDSWS